VQNLEINQFQIGQEEAICKIHNEAFSTWITKLGTLYGYKKITPSDIQQWVTTENNYLLVASEENPIGYLHYQIEKRQGAQKELSVMVVVETCESLGQSKLAVHPTKQKQQIATKMVNAALELAVEQKVDAIQLFAYNQNLPVKRLMEKFDFKHDPLFYYLPFSENIPFAHDSVLAEFNFSKDLPNISLNTEVEIRKVQREDLKNIQQIFGECRPDVFGSQPTFEDVLGWYEAKWGEVTLVADLDGEVAGCMEYNKMGIIGIPGIKKKHQKKGIGSTLFYHLLKDMKEKGYKKALADTGIILQEAISMYQRFQFDLSLELWVWIKILNESLNKS